MKKESLYYFEKAPVLRSVLNFGVPIMVGMLVVIAYNIVDTFFIGMLGDSNLLAAVTLAMPVFTVFMGVGSIFGVGGASFISRLLGQKDYAKAKEVSSFALYGCVLAGALFTLLGLFFIDPLLALLGTSPDTFAATKTYAVVIILGGVPSALTFTLCELVLSEGAAKTAMFGNILGTVVNIALDPLFIFVFGMGVKGAAIATVLANIAVFAFYMYYLLKKSGFLSAKLKDFKARLDTLKETFSIGFLSFLQAFILIAAAVLQNNFAGMYGDVYIAIFGIIFKVSMIPELLSRGLCQGIQPLIGYTFGSKLFERLKSTLKTAGLLSMGICLSMALIVFIFAQNVLGAFISDHETAMLGVPLLKISLLSYLFYTAAFLSTTFFQSAGKAVPAFVMSLIQGAVYMPVLIFITKAAGILGFAYALPIADAATALAGVALFLVYRNVSLPEKSCRIQEEPIPATV